MDSFKNGQSLLGENDQTKHKVLRMERQTVGEMEFSYILTEADGAKFEISVESAIEHDSVFVCGNNEAVKFFELLVRNTVTPCTLHDVFEDVFE